MGMGGFVLQQKLRRVILDDELGICDDLEKDM